MDILVEKILIKKLHEGKLSLTEFNCIMNYIEKLIEKKEIPICKELKKIGIKKCSEFKKEKEVKNDDE